MRITSRHVAGALIVLAGATLNAADNEMRVRATGGDIVITSLAHASVQLEHAGKVIQLDPWSGADLSKAKPADLVLITDADDGAHHLDPKALAQVRKAGKPVVIPSTGRAKVPDGIVMNNGESKAVDGVQVSAIGAYDIKPGEPYHPKGEANGYLLELGGKRIFFAGVTECVPEIQALKDVEVAFMPMNLPQGRMSPAAVADCVKTFRPRTVVPYHFDQGYLARRAGRQTPISADAMADSVSTLADLLSGGSIALKWLAFYPGPGGH
jgi:L-ascorbate metabolism protein UlaG (beta-lactamase superfamily)